MKTSYGTLFFSCEGNTLLGVEHGVWRWSCESSFRIWDARCHPVTDTKKSEPSSVIVCPLSCDNLSQYNISLQCYIIVRWHNVIGNKRDEFVIVFVMSLYLSLYSLLRLSFKRRQFNLNGIPWPLWLVVIVLTCLTGCLYLAVWCPFFSPQNGLGQLVKHGSNGFHFH